MPLIGARLFASTCLGSLLVAGSLAAQSTIRVDGEIQVNDHTPSDQTEPAVAVAAGGQFVVVWASYDQDGSEYGVFARRFDPNGIAQAVEFQVSVRTGLDQTSPAVAFDTAGDFVVTWGSFGQDGDSYGIFARRFDAAGAAQASEFQVNSHTQSYQTDPDIALDADGDFVVTWWAFDGSAQGSFARRFNSSGAALGLEFQVNTYTANNQRYPRVAIDNDGDFVVVWRSSGQDGANYGVFAKRFNAAGVQQANEFQVNTYTTSSQDWPDVAMDASGGFVVVWHSFLQNGPGSIFARRYDSTGAPRSGELKLDVEDDGYQAFATVAMEPDGEFVVAWQSNLQDGSGYGIVTRTFDREGLPTSGELLVNSFTDGAQLRPAVDVAGGDFVVAWTSASQDGGGKGVFAQRFQTFAALDIDGNGATAPLTDGLLVLRFLFGFTGPTLVTGAVDAGNCTRCNATEIKAYLDTLI